MSLKKNTDFVDRYPFLPFTVPVPKYNCPTHGRIWESAVKRENGIVRCRLCNTVLLSYPTIFKPSKPKIEIDFKPMILDSTPKIRSYDYTIPYSSPSIESKEKTSLDEDSVLFNLFKIIVYSIVDLFLLGLLWKLLT